MSEQQAFLEKVHIKNYLSLRNVELPLKPLTVLVGPNASGKSNVLKSLLLLNRMMARDTLPPTEFIQNHVWAGAADHVAFQLHTKVEKTQTLYELVLKAAGDNLSVIEELIVDDVKVISLQNGERVIRDEDGKNETTYRPNKLALRSAGDYGNKPVTSALTEFINGWRFYDFEPDAIRGYHMGFEDFLLNNSKELRESVQLDPDGSTLSGLLSYWYENDQERFESVSKSLEECTNISIRHCLIDGNNQPCLFEGYKNPIPLERASDGTLRLVAYYILLNQPELPSLIAIEEPERSLHPGALRDIAYILERIAERKRVIITTHSSQLLDAFNSQNLSETLGVLLLRNRSGLGTEVINLEDVRGKREALDGWITDFGIGSAIFDSELLQDLMEEPV